MSTLLDSFISHSRSDAERICMVDTNGQRGITSGQFVRMVDSCIHLLRSQGIEEGDVVAIRLDRKAEHIAAFIACMSMGCPYVTINIGHPEKRVERIIGSCSPKATIDEDFIVRASVLDDVPEYTPDDISDDAPYAYFYTSGSTGEPKGVVHNRRILTDDIENVRDMFDPSVIGYFVSVTDYMFTASTTDVSMLLLGKGMHILHRSFILDVESFRRYLYEHDITYAFLNPTFLRSLGPDTPLKCITIAGERPGTFHGFHGKRIVNAYGSTETSIMAWGVVQDGVEPALDSTHHGARLYLSEGDKGEVLLERVPTMRGYVGVEGIGDKFEPIPDSDRKIWHTDDLGIMTERGIVIVGRVDSMVKINGQRVEPAEVEYAISNIPGVTEAVVKAFDDDGRTCLYGYYTSSSHVSEDEVKKTLSKSLPPYMIPSFIIWLESFPRNDRNKVDRQALPKPELSSLRAEHVPPRDYEEEIICDAFSVVLGTDRIGIDDDFFRLGGDSLRAIQISTLCCDKGVHVTTANILSKRTVRAISDVLSKGPVESYHGEIDLTPMQALVIQKDTVPETLLFRTKVPLSPDILQKALDSITDRHDMLRATIDGGIYVLPSGKRTCQLYLGSVCSMDEIHVRGPRSDGVPFECGLYSVDGNDQQFLTISLHPAIADRESYTILMDDLAIAYESVQRGRSMSQDTMSFKQWSDMYEKWMPSKESSEYWESIEKGIEKTKGHDDADWAPFDRYSDISLTELSDNVYGFDLDTIFLSALVYAYCSVTGKGSLTVSMRGSGRSIADVQRTIGQFSNQYPLKLSLVEGTIQSLFDVRRSIYAVPRKGVGYAKSGCHILPDNIFETNTYPPIYNDSFEFMTRLDAGPLYRIHIDGIVDIGICGTEGGSRFMGRYDPSVGDAFIHRFLSFIDNVYGSLKVSDIYEFPFFAFMELMYHTYKNELRFEPDIMPKFFSFTLKFDLPNGIGTIEIQSLLRRLLNVHPILRSRLTVINGVKWCITDRTLEQIVRSPQDASKPPDIDEGFVAIDIHQGDDPFFEIKVLHTIFDFASIEILEKTVMSLIDGVDPIRDFGFLARCLHDQKSHSFDIMEDMLLRYGPYISNPPSIMADCVSKPGVMVDGIVGIDKQEADAFLRKHTISAQVFIIAALSYTMSIITKKSDAQLATLYNGRHIVPENTFFMCINNIFIVVDCEDRTVPDYLSVVVDSVSDAIAFFGTFSTDMIEYTPQTFLSTINYVKQSGTREPFGTEIRENRQVMPMPIVMKIDEYDNCYTFSSSSFRLDANRTVAFIRLFETVANGLMRVERLSDIDVPEDIMRDLPQVMTTK